MPINEASDDAIYTARSAILRGAAGRGRSALMFLARSPA
jgi:hypothetical protein